MINVGIAGCRGYTGEELIKILLKHSQAKINYLTARAGNPQNIAEIFPQFKGRLGVVCKNLDIKEAISLCDILFLALPHTTAMEVVPKLIEAGKKIVDLSADYRLSDYKEYEKAYKVKHTDRKNLKKAVYGIPELYADNIKGAGFVSNPGCYPTVIQLALAPLLSTVGLQKKTAIEAIVIDAKSGYSGAGRKPQDDPFRADLKDNFKAYKVDCHQHLAEINQGLSRIAGKEISVTFVPHILSIERGILAAIYVKTANKHKFSTRNLPGLYKKFYNGGPFVRVKDDGVFPEIKDVINSNYCDIGVTLSRDKNWIIIIAALDNLVKGASGQAVQNMNLMCGFQETDGLL